MNEDIFQSKKAFGDIVTELNQRARSYLGFQGMGIIEAQKQARVDFQGMFNDKEVLDASVQEVNQSNKFIFFKVSTE